ncbi:MAG: hybrid sensor histidine kinase/response regulator, partial [Gammaproteobacteria bacterium]
VAEPAVARVTEEEETRVQEYIRVRSDLLDTMVNTAGEVAIYRSRLEQQVAGFRYNLVELDATVARLREQLRKLELETEAQILSRYQREQHDSGDTAFDPLELDRFSQLQQLSRALAESVSDLVSIQNLLDDLTRQSETLLLQQSRVSSDLQEGLMRTRMVPFESLVPALRRTLRQTAQELGRKAQLKVEGAQGEMDRNLLDRMKAPFEHMLRNALAHGIETPKERRAANKPEEGTVNIALAREATEVVLRVSDDGKGLNRDAIRRKAIERGLLAEDKQVSDRDIFAYILDSGFSTAETVSHIAGRGVGMDVVHNEIKQLGGSLSIDSNPGKGAAFTVRLPFTLAVTQAILVRIGETAYAIPMSAVQGVARIGREDVEKRLGTEDPTYAYAGETYSIHELSQLLGVPASKITDDTQVPLLMTRSGDQRAAVRVDAVTGSREIVVKSVGPQISSVPGILGATIMGDGSVVMILDLAPLLRRAAARRALGEDLTAPVAPLPAALQPKRRLLVMVVDDSITMRKATTRVLERQDMDVITAKDGLDAVEKLQDHIPDIVLLDVEMPRMDGYEFATYMKNDPRTRGVPIIMITSRTGEKHRQRAAEIGVERYLGKPYQEADLLHNIAEAVGDVR